MHSAPFACNRSSRPTATSGPSEPFRSSPRGKGAPVEEQLRRFMGSGGRRKIRYARYLVEALAPSEVPRPLDRVLAYV